MKKRVDKIDLILLLLIITFLSLLSIISSGSSDTTSTSEWLMFGRTLNHTRYYPSAINMTNFGVLWNYSYSSSSPLLFYPYSSPAIAGDILYIGNSLLEEFYAINATNGSKIWNYTGGNIYSSPAIANDIVYIGCLNNLTYAINATNGTQIWNYSTNNSIFSSPTVANDILYIGSSDKNFYALNATNGSKIWNYTMGNDFPRFSPAVVNDIVYMSNKDGNVYAINATNGSKIWNYGSSSSASFFASPAVANDIVYIGDSARYFYAINATNGTQIWNYSLGVVGGFYAAPAVANGIVYASFRSTHVLALNATNGTQIWNYTINTVEYSSPAIANDILYIGGYNDKNFYAINATNGSKIWNYTTGGVIDSSPAIANDIVYIGSLADGLYAFTSLTISSDTIPPNVDITYPMNNSNFTIKTVNVNYTKSDNMAIDSCWYSNDTYTVNKSLGSGGTCTNIINLTWSYQQHNVTVWANDTSGNVGSSKVTFTVNCVESWTCTDWGYCSAGTQTRTCTDANSCGTEDDKPAESQSCVVPRPSGGSKPSNNEQNPYEPTVITTQTETVNDVVPDQPFEIEVTNPGIDVTDISITTTEAVEGEEVEVSTISSPPEEEVLVALCLGGGLGKVYTAFSIKLKKISDRIISNASIGFKVNRTWFFDNNGTLEDLYLLRQSSESGEWGPLQTSFERMDDDYIYFRASTPGFSSFVVFFSQCNCDPNVRKCEKGTVQLCVGNATWVVTDTCDWDCKNGECTAPSDFERVIELFIPTLTIVSVSGGAMIILFVLWSFVKRKFRKKKS